MEEAALQSPEAALEDMDHETLLAHLRARQRFGLAVVAGIGAAIVGAVLWAVFVAVTHYELGLIAIAVGAMVGIAVREIGQGVDMKFGILGGACAAFGWALGMLLGDVAIVSSELGTPYFATLTGLDIDKAVAVASALASPMDLLFLAIAVFEGYKLSLRYHIG